MSEEEKARVTFYLRKDLIKQLNEYAKSAHMNRSQFLTWTFEQVFPMMPIALEKIRTAFKSAGVEVKETEEPQNSEKSK